MYYIHKCFCFGYDCSLYGITLIQFSSVNPSHVKISYTNVMNDEMYSLVIYFSRKNMIFCRKAANFKNLYIPPAKVICRYMTIQTKRLKYDKFSCISVCIIIEGLISCFMVKMFIQEHWNPPEGTVNAF